jgi:hypothetical protein
MSWRPCRDQRLSGNTISLGSLSSRNPRKTGWAQFLVRSRLLKRNLRHQPLLKPGEVLLARRLNERRTAANQRPERFG